MEGKEKIGLKKTGDREGRIFNRDHVIFIIFLILSFIFWYLNSLSKETEGTISYPVRYINSPKDRVLVGNMPANLELSLKGPGYSILKLKLSGNSAPITMDLTALNLIRIPEGKLFSYYIITDGLMQSFENQLRADFKITSIRPDTLFFFFDRIINRNVPVIPVVDVTTERQYFVNGPVSSSPEYVEITGPKQIIDTVKGVKTKRYKFAQLNKSVTRNLPLLTSKLFSINAKKVAITVPVEQFTEATIEVQVKLINLPDSIEIKIFPDVVSVKYLIGISDYKAVNKTPVDAVIDIARYDLNKINKLPVTIQNVPDNISSLRFTPEKVDFILEKKRK